MGILSWIVLGLIAGLLAKLLLPGRDPGGFIITILLGIGGAFVGGWVGTQLGIASFTGFTVPAPGFFVRGDGRWPSAGRVPGRQAQSSWVCSGKPLSR